MAYSAKVLPVMIASPSDVNEQRNHAREALETWNYINSASRNVVLMPTAWETHSAPDLSGRAQEIINDRLLSNCDLLVGIFWTRLGTPTGDFLSGTVEEISRHLDAGKPAMVYFSNAPVAPQSIDQEQFAGVQTFKDWCSSKGIISTFADSEEFRTGFSNQLQIQMNSNPYLLNMMSDNKPEQVPATISQEGKLSKEAKELIVAASEDGAGHVISVSTMGGRFIQTHGQTFGETNPRSMAKWEAALKQLVNDGYLVARGVKGEVFQITAEGYDLADKIRALI